MKSAAPEGELRPPHRLVDPRRRGRNRGAPRPAGRRNLRGECGPKREFTQRDGRAGKSGGFEKIATRRIDHGVTGLAKAWSRRPTAATAEMLRPEMIARPPRRAARPEI